MDASVIIPTHNRRESVLQAVSALLRQDQPPDSYEVIVCCDRCTDGTEGALEAYLDRRLHVIRSPVAGKIGALNAGLRLARGTIAIFLDDEEVADQNLVSSHVHAHRTKSLHRLVVVGYSRVALSSGSSPFTRELAKHYAEFFEDLDRRQQTRQQDTPADLCGSNFSMPVAELHEAGAFNDAFAFPRDDFELAVRLLKRGYQFRLCRNASATMNIALKPSVFLTRAGDQAKNDYALARSYPSCVPYLPFYGNVHDSARRWRARAWWIASKPGKPLLEFARMLAPANLRLLHLDFTARYYATLRDEIGSWRELRRICGPRDDQLKR